MNIYGNANQKVLELKKMTEGSPPSPECLMKVVMNSNEMMITAEL